MNNFFMPITTAWRSLPGQVVIVVSVLSIAALITSCDGKLPNNKTRTVTINNVEPRRDVTGEIIDAHDGCLQFFNGRYYLYGTAYGKTDGMTNNNFRVYSSPDLERWTFEGTLLKERLDAFYYRPYVVFNPSTRKYVLWYNWYPNLKEWLGRHGAAISASPLGPFTIVNPNVHLSHSDTGDGSLFVDDDGTGYFIYTAMKEGFTVRVERLTPDYLDATGQTSGILAIGTEAPVLFRRNNLYYALCGPRCAFCSEGSEVQVLISTSPLGAYTSKPQSNINRHPENGAPVKSVEELWAVTTSSTNGTLSPGSEDKIPMIIRTKNSPFIPAQETWVARIPTPDGPAFFWMADRWQSTPDGIKGHDFQYWSPPLKFQPDGDLLPIENAGQWHVSQVPGK
jgi:hypothetical protein